MRWPFAAGQQGVDGADAGDQRLGDVLAVERVGGGAVEAVGVANFDRGSVVHGFAEAVDDAAEQPGTDFDAGVFAARGERVAQLQAVDFLERHGKHAAVAEADDLGADAAAAGGADLAEIADGDAGAAGFHQQADDFGHLAGPAHGRDAVEFGDDRGRERSS